MLNNDWDEILTEEYKKPYFVELMKKVNYEYNHFTCYPKYDDIANAFRLTSYENTRVVILGQDPYHNEGEAMGLAFSVHKGIKVPPSLVNIYKEMHDDLGVEIPNHGDLTSLSKEGILFLNTCLSVRKNMPGSHKNFGWEQFTDYVIRVLNEKQQPVVFVLWGNFARSKKRLITNPLHLVIEAPHPSPLSAYNGFFGSKPFSKINKFLENTNQKKINFEVLNEN